jgi:hypothetical protein
MSAGGGVCHAASHSPKHLIPVLHPMILLSMILPIIEKIHTPVIDRSADIKPAIGLKLRKRQADDVFIVEARRGVVIDHHAEPGAMATHEIP